MPGKIRIYTSGCPKNQKRCCHKSGSPPPSAVAEKNVVPASLSKMRSARADDSTGNASSNRIATMKSDQTTNGSRKNVNPGCPHIDNRGDVINRADQRGKTLNQQTNCPEVLSPVNTCPLRVSREGCVACPSCCGVSAGYKEPDCHYNCCEDCQPKGEHVQDRERHIACADHQWD